MPKSKQQKKDEVAHLVEQLRSMQSGVVATFSHVKVKDERALRKEMKSLGASYQVVKKTLLKLAFKELTLAADYLEGLQATIVLAVGTEDALTHVKALANFAKGHGTFVLQGGFLKEQGVVRSLTHDEIIALSKLQSREELLARLIGSLTSPLAGMVNVLAGNLRGLVQVLAAYQKAKIA